MFWKFWKRKRKRPKRLIFDGYTKRLDVRRGEFIWLEDRETGEEFFADVSIEKVVVDLPRGLLSKKVETKTDEGFTKLRLRTILDQFGDRKRSFRYIRLNRPVHVRIYGVPHGDVEITISEGDGKAGDEVAADGGGDDEVAADGGGDDEVAVDGGGDDEVAVDGGGDDEVAVDGGGGDEVVVDGGGGDEVAVDGGGGDEVAVDGGGRGAGSEE